MWRFFSSLLGDLVVDLQRDYCSPDQVAGFNTGHNRFGKRFLGYSKHQGMNAESFA